MDNYTRPQDKARWGFTTGADGQIKVGEEKAGELAAPFFNPGDTKEQLDNARGNGGKQLSKAELQKELDGMGVKYAKSATVADLQALLAKAQGPVEKTDEEKVAELREQLKAKGIAFEDSDDLAALQAKLDAAE